MKKLSLCFLVLWVFLFIGLFQLGIRRSMHRTFDGPVEDYAWSISTAISDLSHNLNEGYMYYADMRDVIEKEGMSSGHPRFGELSRPERLQQLYQHLNHLPVDQNQRSLKAQQIRPIAATCLGMVDFFKASYTVFGFKSSSPYRFYFVILGLTCALFFITHYKKSAYVLFPSIVLCAMALIMNSPPRRPIWGFQYLDILAVIPAMQILLSCMKAKNSPNFTTKEIVLSILQGFILCFIISLRRSAIYSVLAFLFFCVGSYFVGFLNIEKKDFKNLLQMVLPFVVLIGFVLLGKIFVTSYKQVMFFSSFGIRTIKEYHLSWMKLNSAIAITLAGATFFHWILWKKLREFNLSTRLLISLVSFTVLFALPVISFVFKERPDYFFLPVTVTSKLKSLHLLVALFFIFFLRKELNYLISNLTKKRLSMANLKQLAYAPVLCFLFCFNIYQLALNCKYHPVYSTNDVLPHHLVYHNALIGLCWHPKMERHPDELDNFSWYSGLTKFVHGEKKKGKYVTAEHYMSSFSKKNFKMRLHDKCVRACYLRYILRHPLLVIGAHYYKLKHLIRVSVECLSFNKQYLPYSMLFILLSLVITFWRLHFYEQFRNIFIAMGCLALFASVPNLYAHPHPWPENFQLIWMLFFMFSIIYLFDSCLVRLIKKFKPAFYKASHSIV